MKYAAIFPLKLLFFPARYLFGSKSLSLWHLLGHALFLLALIQTCGSWSRCERITSLAANWGFLPLAQAAQTAARLPCRPCRFTWFRCLGFLVATLNLRLFPVDLCWFGVVSSLRCTHRYGSCHLQKLICFSSLGMHANVYETICLKRQLPIFWIFAKAPKGQNFFKNHLSKPLGVANPSLPSSALVGSVEPLQPFVPDQMNAKLGNLKLTRGETAWITHLCAQIIWKIASSNQTRRPCRLPTKRWRSNSTDHWLGGPLPCWTRWGWKEKGANEDLYKGAFSSLRHSLGLLRLWAPYIFWVDPVHHPHLGHWYINYRSIVNSSHWACVRSSQVCLKTGIMILDC